MTQRADSPVPPPISAPAACTAGPKGLDDVAQTRLALQAHQEESDAAGRPELAAAYRRLALLAEVCECIAEDSPATAHEIAAFTGEAIEALSTVGCDADAECALRWVVNESSARWGEYLLLIDTEAGNAEHQDEIGSIEDPGSNEPTIDSATLFKLLTGCAPSGEAASKVPTPHQPVDLPKQPEPQDAPDETVDARSLQAQVAPIADPRDEESSKPARAETLLPARRSSEAVVAREPTERVEIPSAPQVLSIDPELRECFLAEAGDLFERIESLVVQLGSGHSADEVLPELGRCFHTLKGAAGSVGLADVSALVHDMEDRLGAVSAGSCDELLDQLHKVLQYLEGVFAAMRRGGPLPQHPEPPDHMHKPSVQVPKTVPRVALVSSQTAQPSAAGQADLEKAVGGSEGPVRVSSERIDGLMDLVSELITRRGLWAAQADTMKEFASMARTCRARMLATVDKLRDLRPVRDSASHLNGPRSLVDREADVSGLIRRIAEDADDLSVLTESAQAAAKPLADNCDALARLTLDLWESLQSIRIVPVRGLFQRLTRVAQDAARVEGRQVEVVMAGEDTGLDRAVADKAVEPLLHVVRNAVCHGIEPAEERVRQGKPAAGRVTLEASRAGNTMVLSVHDDGRGLDHDAIAAKGRRLGLIAPGDVPSVDRLNALIFQPGFSTREEASAIAGRGVGMDVVSQEVGRLPGTITLTSVKGQGTRLNIGLPARLALEQAMITRIDGRSFALPVDLIDQAQAFECDDVDRTGPYPRVRMREQWVPLIDAREALGISSGSSVQCPKVLLVRADGEPVAVVVDSIDGTRELVIRPLGPLLSGHPVVSGTSLSVNGEVVFALSPSGLARPYRELEETNGNEVARPSPPTRSPRILVVDDSISVRRVVARQFRSLGYEVEEVSDGLEALGRARNQRYDLIFSDLEMPRMDGFELLAELGRLSVLATTPVVIATSRCDPETRRRAGELGARDFLPKPIDSDRLAAVVRGLLQIPEPSSAEPAAAGDLNGTDATA